MATPSTADLNYYTGKDLTNLDWKVNFDQIVAWLTDGAADLIVNSITTNAGLTIGGNITTTGIVTAGSFVGDGSGLTGIGTEAQNLIFNGDMSIKTLSTTGTILLGSTENQFVNAWYCYSNMTSTGLSVCNISQNEFTTTTGPAFVSTYTQKLDTFDFDSQASGTISLSYKMQKADASRLYGKAISFSFKINNALVSSSFFDSVYFYIKKGVGNNFSSLSTIHTDSTAFLGAGLGTYKFQNVVVDDTGGIDDGLVFVIQFLRNATGGTDAGYVEVSDVKLELGTTSTDYVNDVYNINLQGAGAGISTPDGRVILKTYPYSSGLADNIEFQSGSNLQLLGGNIISNIGNLTLTLGNLYLTNGDINMTLGDINMTQGDLTVGKGNIYLTGPGTADINFHDGAIIQGTPVHSLSFMTSTSSTEVMYLSQTGNVFIGSTAAYTDAGQKLRVNGNIKIDNGNYLMLANTTGGTIKIGNHVGGGLDIYDDNVVVGTTGTTASSIAFNANPSKSYIGATTSYLYINAGTYVDVLGDGDGTYLLYLPNAATKKAKAYAWDVYSDKTLKENIIPIKYSLDDILQLNPVSYNFKTEPNVSCIGFIAQDVKPIIPEIVSGTEGNYGMNYSGLIPILVKAIQELKSEIEVLKNKIQGV